MCVALENTGETCLYGLFCFFLALALDLYFHGEAKSKTGCKKSEKHKEWYHSKCKETILKKLCLERMQCVCVPFLTALVMLPVVVTWLSLSITMELRS